jgi:hypothetical protein
MERAVEMVGFFASADSWLTRSSPTLKVPCLTFQVSSDPSTEPYIVLFTNGQRPRFDGKLQLRTPTEMRICATSQDLLDCLTTVYTNREMNSDLISRPWNAVYRDRFTDISQGWAHARSKWANAVVDQDRVGQEQDEGMIESDEE